MWVTKWIDNSYNSAEVFAPGYCNCVFRKDHCGGADSVFICIKDTLHISVIPSLDTGAEIKIDILEGNPAHCSCGNYNMNSVLPGYS